jgi:hypothetical protein
MFRDIHQLEDAPPFGFTAIEGLLTVETSLQEALRYIPYCDEHKNIWSSHFARIILDASSQVDSIWKATSKIIDPASSSEIHTIRDHFDRYGSWVAKQKVVFFGSDPPILVNPFIEWEQNFSSPKWWKAYNSLKHDRFTFQKEATLECAVSALAALFLAIVYSGTCDLALIISELLDPTNHNPWAFTKTGLLRDVRFDCWAKIETKLFAHPLGVFGVNDCNLGSYWSSKSSRFNLWWTLNWDKYNTRNKCGN